MIASLTSSDVNCKKRREALKRQNAAGLGKRSESNLRHLLVIKPEAWRRSHWTKVSINTFVQIRDLRTNSRLTVTYT
jgi:hypothetical protein